MAKQISNAFEIWNTLWLILWRWNLLKVILKREKDPVRACIRFFNIKVLSYEGDLSRGLVGLVPALRAELWSSFPTQQNKVSVERKVVFSCGPNIHGDKLLQMLWTKKKLQPSGPYEDWLSCLSYLVQYIT